ncbi:MAG: Trk system potassium transporter TrkA [Clostridia bacterium]|nr:Trk system potassium transporter TrkA [Clostridia bacterium]
MKILIAGCGDVGKTLAKQLSAEGYDLTLMDADPEVLETGIARYDVMTVQGNCGSMDTLRRAGVKKSNLLIACTGSDELNLLCCMTAHTMNPRLHTIARIRDPEYLEQVYAMRDAFGISMTFNPEQDAATEMERLIKYPGFLKRESFLGGRVEIAELRVDADSRLCNVALNHLSGIVKCQILICAVLRDGVATIPDGNFILEEGDRVFVTASSDDLSMLLKSLGIVTHRVRRVMIAGGGTVAYYLAKGLKNNRSIEIEVIEKDAERCRELAELLPRVKVIKGDACDRALLESEGLSATDTLVSTTGLDELNVITSLYGSGRKLSQIITVLDRMENIDFIADLPLGSVISPSKLCCNTIVRYVRAMQKQAGAAVTIHTIADGRAEAIEFPVDLKTRFRNTPLKQIKLRSNIRLACIARGNEIIIPNGDSYFAEGDSVVVVVSGGTVVLNLNDIFD